MKVELEDIQGNKFEETIPKYPPASIKNKCESVFNAQVKMADGNREAKIENAFEAVKEEKEIVVNWLNNNWFENDLGPDRLSPPSQDKILGLYSDYIEGIEKKDEAKDSQKKSSVKNDK